MLKTRYELRYQVQEVMHNKMLTMRFQAYDTAKEATDQAKLLSKRENGRYYYVLRTQTETVFKIGKVI